MFPPVALSTMVSGFRNSFAQDLITHGRYRNRLDNHVDVSDLDELAPKHDTPALIRRRHLDSKIPERACCRRSQTSDSRTRREILSSPLLYLVRAIIRNVWDESYVIQVLHGIKIVRLPLLGGR